jgi:hypothetical protein
MCTVSVVTRKDGYVLAMNRDERTARGEHARPPEALTLGGTPVVMPRESSGGTWIAANAGGVALALLNWHTPGVVSVAERSRGLVIPRLIVRTSQAAVQRAIEGMDLEGIRPFRLVGVFPRGQEICEWRWDSVELDLRWFGWQPHHWFSSGLGDAAALEQRSAACTQAWKHSDSGSLAWLRRLHRSHRAQPRELAICVHREGVATVSYTELVCTPATLRCAYAAGTPCSAPGSMASVALPRRARLAHRVS